MLMRLYRTWRFGVAIKKFRELPDDAPEKEWEKVVAEVKRAEYRLNEVSSRRWLVAGEHDGGTMAVVTTRHKAIKLASELGAIRCIDDQRAVIVYNPKLT